MLHKKEDTILVCYVDHHDKAYTWAQKRKIEVHPERSCPNCKYSRSGTHTEQEGIPTQNDKKEKQTIVCRVSLNKYPTGSASRLDCTNS
ncbi:MAG: hypothetical protein H7A24_06195 [Leptospiraceae bacterium]|nr:hypothetical protein [Leptospiraceae bacterium]